MMRVRCLIDFGGEVMEVLLIVAEQPLAKLKNRLECNGQVKLIEKVDKAPVVQ